MESLLPVDYIIHDSPFFLQEGGMIFRSNLFLLYARCKNNPRIFLEARIARIYLTILGGTR